MLVLELVDQLVRTIMKDVNFESVELLMMNSLWALALYWS
jgi:hypothetical protein